MRKSPNTLLLGVLLLFGLGLLCLFLFQSAWLKTVLYLVNKDQSAGLPVSSTPITGFSFPTAAAPAPIGREVPVGKLAITVRRVVRPADSAVGNANLFKSLEQDEQYLMVDINVRCTSAAETCRLTEFDFGVKTDSGRDYTAEFSSSFEGLDGLFEGGEIGSGKSLSGSLIFIIHKTDQGLKLIYPRMHGFGATAEFLLGR